MLKSQEYRIYPTEQQKCLLEQHFGCARFVYNKALECKIEAWTKGKTLSTFDLIKQLPELKKELPWLYDVSADTLQTTIRILGFAYDNFFNGSGFPKFKKKGNKDSCTFPQDNSIKDDKLYIPKFREGIKIVLSKEIEGKIKSVTITRTKTNKYFASILFELEKQLPIKPEITEETSIGIDTGIKTLATCSNGVSYDNHKYLKKNLDKLKKLQQSASRKKKGSNNRTKANLKVAKLHEKIHNQRIDYLHKTTYALTHDSQVDTIVVESLNIQGMMANHKLSQALSDVSLGEFYRQLKYKSEWYGKNLIEIDRFYPSSKTCSTCGSINNELLLSHREWQCVECYDIHNRDFNASINIKVEGLRKYKSGQQLPKASSENISHKKRRTTKKTH